MKPQIENLGKVSITVEKQYWTKDNQYARLTIVEDINTIASYISRKDVPSGIDINNREYWIPIGRVSDYLEVFVEEEKAMLLYLEASVRNALKNNQEFHDGALNEVQSKVNYLDEIITNAVNTINSTNTTLNSNEVDRVSAENKRLTAENERVTKENERIAAEALRQNAELNRETAEKERQHKYTNEYDVYENNRRNAETLRNAAESARQEQEAYRIANENNRQNAETIRQSSENVRNSSETNRQQGEQARVTAENARIIAETNRQLQEGNYSDKPDANGSRWARFNQAEAERSNTAQQGENNRNAKFNSAETTRQNTFTTNEGKSTDAANANGSRWARFNKTINDANTKLNNKITEIQNKANQDLGDLNEFAETVTNIEEILENKANIDGSYESMSVGKASNLLSNVTKNHTSYITHWINNEMYNFFELPTENVDDGLAEIKTIELKGAIYNQLIKPNYTLKSNGVNVTNVDNIITIEGTTLTDEGIQLYPELFPYEISNPYTILTYIESNGEYTVDKTYAKNAINIPIKHYFTRSKSYKTEPIKIYPPANTYVYAKLRLQIIHISIGLQGLLDNLMQLYYIFGDKIYDYNYNPGELVQVKNIKITSHGSNILKSNTIVSGDINEIGEVIESTTMYTHKEIIPVMPGLTYYCKGINTYLSNITFYGYDKSKNFINILKPRSTTTEYPDNGGTGDRLIDIPDNVYYLRIKYTKRYNYFNYLYPIFTNASDAKTVFELNLVELSNNNENIPACKNFGLTINNTLEVLNNNVYVSSPYSQYMSSENIVPNIISTSIGNVLVYTIEQILRTAGSGFGSEIQIIDKNNYPIYKRANSSKQWVKYNLDITNDTILSELQTHKVLGNINTTVYNNNTYSIYILTNYNTIEEAMDNITFYVYSYNVSSKMLLNCKELKYYVYKDGYQTVSPGVRLAIEYPTPVKNILSNLHRTYINKISLNSLLSALNTATGKTINATYNQTTQSYDFTVK